jgi:riboflavin kinase, archaea type
MLTKLPFDAPFEGRNMKVLRGRVVSGQGNFSYWIGQLQEHYKRKTGMVLYPGTLNIELAEPFSFPADVLRLEGSEYGGRVSVNILPCSVRGKPAFILRTDLNESGKGPHPKTIVEIATDVRLRDYFSLSDGDALEVEMIEEQRATPE